MKRFISAFLALIMLTLFVCGCDDSSNTSEKPNGFDYTTDMQYYYNSIGDSKLQCTESDKGYYYKGDHGIVIFVDKKTMEGTPLCNKVNCLHNDPDECYAYGYGNIQYYSGYLFTDMSKYDYNKMSDISYIYKVSEDGASKERITNGFKDVILDWFIHRDNLYYVTASGLYKIPVSSPKSDPSVIIDFQNKGLKNINLNKFVAYKNYVYLSVSSMPDDDEADSNYFVNLFTYNIESETLDEITFDDELTEIATFFNDSMITYQTVKNKDDTYNAVYYISDLNGDNRRKYAEYPSGYYLFSDGEYVYVDNGAYVNFSEENADKKDEAGNLGQTITVYNFEMEEIDSFVLPFAEWIDMCPQGLQHFLLTDKNDKEEYELYYIDKNKIGQYNSSVADKKLVCKLNWKSSSNSNENIYAATDIVP